MPHMCCVPHCRGNYRTGPKVSVFSFPYDEDLAGKWLQAIKRDHYIPTTYSRVCELHFKPDDIEHITSQIDEATGRMLTAKLMKPRLTEGAVPSLLPNCPFALSASPAIVVPPYPRRKQRKDGKCYTCGSLKGSKTVDDATGRRRGTKRYSANTSATSEAVVTPENEDELADTSSAETSDVKTEDETNTALPTISAVQGKAEEIEVKVEVFEEQLQEDVFDNPQQAISFVDVAEQRVKDEQDDQPDLAKSHISPEPQNLEHFVKCLSTEDHSEANCKDPLDNLGTPFTEHSLHVQSPAVTAFPFRHDQPGSTYVKHLHMGMGTQNTLSDVIMSETKSKNVGAKKKPSKSTESQNPDAVFLEYVKVYLSKMNERQKNKAKIGIMELLHKCAEEA